MKKLLTLFAMGAMTCILSAQPQKLNYQCVIRDLSGKLVTSQSVGLRISILQGSATGTVIYQETFSPNPQTNANGLLSVEIGGGTATVGPFSAIDWSSGSYFLKTETDPAGGTSYTITGTSQLLSVAYSLYAKSAGNGFSGSFPDLTNKPATLTGYGITDGMNTTHPAYGITQTNINNWNTAFGWGNHSGLYRSNTWVPAWSDVTGKPTFATVATSGNYNDLSNKPAIPAALWTSGGSNIYYNSGYVGVGIASPLAPVHISANSLTNLPQLMLTETESDYARLSFNNTIRTGKVWSIAGLTSEYDSDSRFNIWYSTDGTVIGGKDILSITGNGWVGIQNTNPGTYLDIFSPGIYTYGITPIIRIRDNIKTWNIGMGDEGDRFSIASGDFAERFNILSNGYVGIGTIAPLAGLHIKGNTWPGSFLYLESSSGQDAGIRLYEGTDLKWHLYNDASAGGFILQNYGLNIGLFCRQSDGFVGIGTTTPNYKLHVEGTTYCTGGAWTASDIRWKRNISNLSNILPGIMGLNAVNYDLRTDEFPEMGFESGRQIGLIAQDVENIFPELVRTDNHGYKSVSYEKLSVLLLEGIKEQQRQIDELKKEIEFLKTR